MSSATASRPISSASSSITSRTATWPRRRSLTNVLFGRIGHKHTDGSERIRAIVRDLFESLGLYNKVLVFGLDFDVGAGGNG